MAYIILNSHKPWNWDENFSEDEFKGQVVSAYEAAEPLEDGVDERDEGDDGD